jgi:hypothetical protein
MGPQYANAGWGTSLANLFPGAYTFVYYPHSTATGQFEFGSVVTKEVTVAGGALTWIESPAFGATLPVGGFLTTVNGWAIKMGATGNSGIDTVHLWAVNANTGAATFLGADYGRSRPDIAAAFGGNFQFSGFSVTIGGRLPAGFYYLIAYSHDAATQTFNYVKVWFVVVQ